MKIREAVLANMMYSALTELLANRLGHSPCSQIEPEAFDEAEFAIGIKRALAQGKKRIVLDIVYPKERVD